MAAGAKKGCDNPHSGRGLSAALRRQERGAGAPGSGQSRFEGRRLIAPAAGAGAHLASRFAKKFRCSFTPPSAAVDMTAILGISAFYHDSASALVVDGDIVAAAQEERFSRRKHDPGFP